VFLGWLILDETITVRTLVAGAIIVAAVAIIISTGGTARTDDRATVESEPESEQAVA
jgi:hypothetical protein